MNQNISSERLPVTKIILYLYGSNTNVQLRKPISKIPHNYKYSHPPFISINCHMVRQILLPHATLHSNYPSYPQITFYFFKLLKVSIFHFSKRYIFAHDQTNVNGFFPFCLQPLQLKKYLRFLDLHFEFYHLRYVHAYILTYTSLMPQSFYNDL